MSTYPERFHLDEEEYGRFVKASHIMHKAQAEVEYWKALAKMREISGDERRRPRG